MPEGGSVTMGMLRWCVVLCVSVMVACSDEDISLADTVRTLKAQVSALLERRQEDYRILEDSLRRSLEKNSQLSSLREEVRSLRQEVEALRHGGSTTQGNQQKNDHLTVQWLASAVSELRGEVIEVAAAHNTSAELQRQEELNSELSLMRKDIAVMRRDLEEEQAAQLNDSAGLAQTRQDVLALKAQVQNAASLCADTRAQFLTAQTEWTIAFKALKKSAKTGKVYKDPFHEEKENLQANTLDDDKGEKRYRHHRIIRIQVSELEKSARKLSATQMHLDHQVRRLEKQMKTFLSNHHSSSNHEAGAGEVAARQLQGRVSNLELASRMAAKSVFNITRQLVGLDKLHQSMLQLLESVETLENKVDHSVPDLQREISKMEFNMAQITSSIALIKEDQDNQRSSLKALSSSASVMQENLDTDHGRLSLLQAQVLNLSASLDQPLLQAQQHVNSSSLVQLVGALSRLQREYQRIVTGLPHDCGSVQGPTGLYLILPGGQGTPILASCDQNTSSGGWTVVQRRVDGSQEFNRKWKEYAVGFGSPSGEFWVGNDALHRLTGHNCSSLRVDIRDIYGKSWVAEYDEFSVSDGADGYRIHVDGYRGNASDALEYQNRMQFSTIDSDRDISNTHCASNYEGGWWFSHCQHANLNGRYNLGLTWFDSSKNEWIAVAWSEMKVRGRPGCEPHG